MFFFIDPLYLLFMAPAFLFSLYAQFKVNSAFKRYSQVAPSSGMTGAEASRVLLDRNGLNDVAIEQVSGNLSDNYDPRTRVLRLSQGVYAEKSLAALGIAAHETGHALQDARHYWPMKLRGGLVPAANIGTRMAWPLFFLGIVFAAWFRQPQIGGLIMNIAIVVFTIAVFFTVITLPVEFNASRRAMAMLSESGVINQDEYRPTRKVLSAAAMTYLAAAAVAILQLLYMIIRSREQ